MLATPRARSNGLSFAFGWVAGLVIVSVVVLLVAGGADDPNSGSSDAVNWVKVAFGVVFVLAALKQWRSRPTHGQEPTMPKWMATVDEFTVGKSLGLGVILSAANPKNLALTLAASASIAQAGLSTGASVIAVAVFVVIASITVVGPVLFFVFAPRVAVGPLDAIKQFMADHNAVIMFVVLLVLGAKLLGDGIGGVTA
jgi:threonine/homoserine/homoserine lactone efflux protein